MGPRQEEDARLRGRVGPLRRALTCPRAVRAFSIVELVIATGIFVVIMGVTLGLLSGTSKEHDDLRANLDANERVLKAFERLGHEIFEASLVEWPPVLDPAIAPPPFVHRSPAESTGRLVLVAEKPFVNGRANGIESMRRKAVFYLDKPAKLGVDTKGQDVVTYTLFEASEPATSAVTAVAIVDGVTELVFWRVAAFDAADRRGGSGPAVVHVLLRAANVRARPDHKLSPGYQAEFVSCFAIRGKDITARRDKRQEAP